ncbi:helix-turn-helix transcriptional regulator [Streptomyces sp. NPDC005438]|uniref:helix-turn-helix domain-containing protein n=1 Tax=Streptomyces sp. NPDC005438 TaxID=3156880 RepID=UPI0033B423AE
MAAEEGEGHTVVVHLDAVLRDRGMTLTELAAQVGVSNVNLSVLKNGRAKAVRFTTLTRLCEVLRCQPGDLLTVRTAPLGDRATTDAQAPPGEANPPPEDEGERNK